MENFKKYVNRIIVGFMILCTLIYFVFYLVNGHELNEVYVNIMVMALEAGAFMTSLLILILVATEKDTWLGEAKDYRFNLALGCLFGVFFSGILVYNQFESLFATPA